MCTPTPVQALQTQGPARGYGDPVAERSSTGAVKAGASAGLRRVSPYGPGRATDQLHNPQRLDGLTAAVCDGLMGQPDKLHG